MLMDKNNKPKTDGRFRMFKKKGVNEDTMEEHYELFELMEATEKFSAEIKTEEGGAGDEGTPRLLARLKKDTPLSEANSIKAGDEVRLKAKYAESKNEAKLVYVVKELRGPRVLIAPKVWKSGIVPTESVQMYMIQKV
jgi:hypothetical protein